MVLSFLFMRSHGGLDPFYKRIDLYTNIAIYISSPLLWFFVNICLNSLFSSSIELGIFGTTGDTYKAILVGKFSESF